MNHLLDYIYIYIYYIYRRFFGNEFFKSLSIVTNINMEVLYFLEKFNSVEFGK